MFLTTVVLKTKMGTGQSKNKQTNRVAQLPQTSELAGSVDVPLAVSTTGGAETGKETQPLQASDSEQSEVSTSKISIIVAAAHVQEWCL